MSTILVTGCSSGFGLETAKVFSDRGWDVVATMRNPHRSVLTASNRLRVLPLDVTDPNSIARCVAEAGPIDVLVNNAGLGVPSPIEMTEASVARTMFETNALGTLAMIQAVLPAFRARRSGGVLPR
ncbi:MAG: SDR family NAD(P)-dependent oxidoreductase [Pseudoxanthomonas sp.]|nr:SDR family NAD(P)-dependent oxidoreductase [Pseudoxanthomonas sp.]